MLTHTLTGTLPRRRSFSSWPVPTTNVIAVASCSSLQRTDIKQLTLIKFEPKKKSRLGDAFLHTNTAAKRHAGQSVHARCWPCNCKAALLHRLDLDRRAKKLRRQARVCAD